jgi:hypothetical protein
MKWENWMYAPKDGTTIIAIHTDYSGCALIFWGESLEGEKGWVTTDGIFEGADSTYAGYITCPEYPLNEKNQDL